MLGVMPRWLTDEQQRAWRAYRRMVLLVDSAVARDLSRDSGLSMPDYLVLSALSEADDHRRRLTDLAARMQWSQAGSRTTSPGWNSAAWSSAPDAAPICGAPTSC